jgi:biopolymer transport protein TolR
MSMTSGSSGGLSHDINVTPLIDVLLVLLIIFMVIVPVTPRGLDSLVPQPPKNKTNDQPDTRTVVVQVISRGNQEPVYKINQDDVAKADLFNRLEAIYAIRAEKVMFVKGDDDVYYQYIAQVIDTATKAGVENIGLITPKVEAGQ